MHKLVYPFRNLGFKLGCTWRYWTRPRIVNGKIALHAMFRDEAPYLKEWIDFHLSQGIDYIYLTNDGSSDNWEELLQAYVKAGYLEYENSIDHSDFYTREEYHKNRILAKASKSYEWIAFLDSDEFWYCEEAYAHILAQAPKNAAGLVFNWLIYGTAHVERLGADEWLLEKLNRRFPDGHEENQQVKSVLRPAYGPRFFNKNPHYPNYSPLAPLYWSDGLRFRPGQKRVLLKPGHIKHYWYRTEVFFREVKRARRQFFEGKERSALLEDWHYRRSNAVLDQFPAKALRQLKEFRKWFEQNESPRLK